MMRLVLLKYQNSGDVPLAVTPKPTADPASAVWVSGTPLDAGRLHSAVGRPPNVEVQPVAPGKYTVNYCHREPKIKRSGRYL